MSLYGAVLRTVVVRRAAGVGAWAPSSSCSPVSPHLRRGLSPTKLLPTAAAHPPSPTTHRRHDQRRARLQQCRTAAADKVLYPAGMHT